MSHVVLAASGDAVEFVLFLIVFIIFVIGSLIKKAIEGAKGSPQSRGGARPQSTPWEDVKRFLNEAGVQTQTRPRPPQQMQRPAPKVRPAPTHPRRPPAQRPTRRPAPRPTMRRTPRPSMAPPPPPPPPPQPKPQRMAAPQRPPKPKAAPKPQAPAPRREAPAAVVPASVLSLKDLTPSQLRNAIVLREVFGPPLAGRRTASQGGFLP